MSPDDRSNTSPGGLRDFLYVLFKHRKQIVFIFAAIVVVTAIVSFIITPVYESNANLLVKIGREYAPKSDVGSDARNYMVVNQQEIINSEIQILTSLELYEKVVGAMGIATLYPKIARDPPERVSPRDAAVEEFADNVGVEDIRRSNVISVSFQHPDPDTAQLALEQLIGFYKEKRLEVFSSPDPSALERQLAVYQERLAQSENDLEAFKQQGEVYSLDEQRSLLLNQRTDLVSNLKNRRHRIDELEDKVGSYRRQLREISRSDSPYTQTELDKIVVNAQQKLLDLQLRERELLGKNYRPDGRLIQNVRREIELVQKFLQEQEREISQKVIKSSPVYQEIEKEMLKAEAELKAEQRGAETLTRQIAEVDRELENLDEKENELRGLTRALSIDEDNYRTYMAKLEEARISEFLDKQKIDNVSIIQPPKLPQKPVKPKKGLAIFLSLFVGGFTGLLYAFAAEYMSQKLSTPEQVKRRLGLPVLASIEMRPDRCPLNQS